MFGRKGEVDEQLARTRTLGRKKSAPTLVVMSLQYRILPLSTIAIAVMMFGIICSSLCHSIRPDDPSSRRESGACSKRLIEFCSLWNIMPAADSAGGIPWIKP